MTAGNRRYPGSGTRSRLLPMLIAVFALLAVFGILALPEPVSADDHKVTTVSEDHYVYCGGTYDFVVKPEEDENGNPLYTAKSYRWKVKLKDDHWSSSHYCSEYEDPTSWFYDTETPHFKMNMVNFLNGSDDDDWGSLRFSCEVTDTKGRIHWSDTYMMHVGSRAELQSRWKTETDSSNYVQMTDIVPANGSGGVTKVTDDISKLTMETGESMTFSFNSSQNAPYWLVESDPSLVNTINMITPDGSVNKSVKGNTYTFKPAKAGEYLIDMFSYTVLGSGYDFSRPDLKGLGKNHIFLVTVTDPEETVPERTTVTGLPGATIWLGMSAEETKTLSEIPAPGSTIPGTRVLPTLAAKNIGVFSGSAEAPAIPAGWYKYVSGIWKPVESLGENAFQAGGSYRFQVAVTAKEGYEFGPDERSADVTPLRQVLIYESGKAGPNNNAFMPDSRSSTSQRVVYVIRSFTVPESAAENAEKTPSASDISDDMKKDLSEGIAITGLEDLVYNGKAQYPPVFVYWNDQLLKDGTDYILTYTSNEDVGEAVVAAEGTGEFTGKSTETFRILPKGRAISSIGAAKTSLTVNWKKQAEKMSVKRITGYEIRYSLQSDMTDAATVEVSGYKKTSKKLTGLDRKTKYYVQLRTYMDKDGNRYESPWSPVKSKKTK